MIIPEITAVYTNHSTVDDKQEYGAGLACLSQPLSKCEKIVEMGKKWAYTGAFGY